MNLIELSELLLDEKKAEQYLLGVGILKTFTACEKCGSSKLGRIRRGRFKCYGCMAEWSFRKNSILEGQSISCSKFLGLVKLFELDSSALKSSIELHLGTKTTQRMRTKIRKIIAEVNNSNKYDVLLKGESPVFSMVIVKGIVKIDQSSNPKSSDLFTIKRSRVPNKETMYQLNHKRINSKDIRRTIKNYSNDYYHFWRYANCRLQQFRGTKLKYLFIYLKEIEFRYNNQANMFDGIIEKIANFKGWS